ncbi:MAG: hypothetical protein KAY32_00345 [Candidatus Eisenbacteria sp.]|nr:hypothetical protein [Candidatus Eisenbacteria bacterium]
MPKLIWLLLVVISVAVGPGCSRQNLAVHMTAPVIEAALIESFASRDRETVRQGIPGQLLLLRGLCRSDPGHLGVWTTTVQLYASHAMFFVEPEDPDWAVALYGEGKDLGLRFLMRKDWFAEAWNAGPDSLRAEIERRRPVDLGPLMMWTAACLGQYVLYNQDRPRVMLDLPYVHVLLDASMVLSEKYFYGMPYVIKGILLALVPQGYGGNLEESDRYFQKAMAIAHRRFLLQQVLYARHCCAAALDEECFVTALEEVLAAPEDLLPEMRFVNVVAREQAREMLERREEFF